MEAYNLEPVSNLDDIKYQPIEQTGKTKKRAGILVRLGLAGLMLISPVLEYGCNGYKKPIKPATEASQKYETMEDKVYNLMKNCIENTELSEMVVFKDGVSTTYASREIAPLLQMINSPQLPLKGEEVRENLQRQGYFITIHGRESQDKVRIEFAYVNHPSLQGPEFVFEQEGDNTRTIVVGNHGQEHTIYKMEGNNLVVNVGNPDAGMASVPVTAKVIQRAQGYNKIAGIILSTYK